MRIPRMLRHWTLAIAAVALLGAADTTAPARDNLVQCANLIYAGSKSSRCFSAKFLEEVRDETQVDADSDFTPVKLSSADVFNYPFAVMTGEGEFTLFEEERTMLKSYLTRGGFLLASAGCSSREWDRSFRREFKNVFPDKELHKIPMEHPLFKTVFNVERINLKNGGTTLLEGLELDGRIVLVYSSEGLNDTGNVQGCCCCGGNEVKNSRDVNTDIIAYALTH